MNNDTAASFGGIEVRFFTSFQKNELESSLISGMKTGSLFDTYFREERDWEISLENVPLVSLLSVYHKLTIGSRRIRRHRCVLPCILTGPCLVSFTLSKITSGTIKPSSRSRKSVWFLFWKKRWLAAFFERRTPSEIPERLLLRALLSIYRKTYSRIRCKLSPLTFQYYSTKGQLEKLKDLFVRLRDMLHYNPQLRIDAFFNPEFKKVTSHIHFGTHLISRSSEIY